MNIRKLVLTALILFAILFLAVNGIVLMQYLGVKYVDNIDYEFKNDMHVIGRWEEVDFVFRIDNFEVGKPRSNDLEIKYIEFYEDGKVLIERNDATKLKKALADFMSILWRPEKTWTEGIVIDSFYRTASHFTINEIEGHSYMFLQHKSGNYSVHGRKEDLPFYVLKKVEV